MAGHIPQAMTTHTQFVAHTKSLAQPPLHPEAVDAHAAIANYSRFTVALAEDNAGHMLCWRPVDCPHLAVVGDSGCGQTVTIQNAAVQFARAHWAVHIAARFDFEYAEFRSWANVRCVATKPDKQIALIGHLRHILQQRIRAGRTRVHAPAVLLIDNLYELTGNFSFAHAFAGTPTADPAAADLRHLLQYGRQARIHVLAATLPRSQSAQLDSETRENFVELPLSRRHHGPALSTYIDEEREFTAHRNLAVLRPTRASYQPLVLG